MAEVLDLRQFRSSQLDGLLSAETEEWRRELDWDYASSADLIRQYVEARILPGFVLGSRSFGRGEPHGYCFFIYEAQKGLIGDLFVHPRQRLPGYACERLLLAHMIETLQATPGLRRIEAQLMPFRPEELGDSFAAAGFRAFRRLFLRLDLDSYRPAHPVGGDGVAAAVWRESDAEAAARLILRAYHGHVDSLINDQYRSLAGAARFLHNIAHYPGCGIFDAGSSLVSRSALTGEPNGMILVSRVRPDVAHITQVCVGPEHQGRGLGRALLTQCLERLRQQGLRTATLTVTGQNQGACRLYRGIGFQVAREFDAYVWESPAA